MSPTPVNPRPAAIVPLILAVTIAMPASAHVTEAADPALKECRLSCKQANGACIAYANNGALFILWDEAETGDGPIGMLVLSPKAKGKGYQNSIHYTHSSTLRTIEEIFGVTPMLGDAANATDLSDLFVSFP